MTTVLIVIHLMVVLAMIGLILLQRSEGGALGIGGGSGAFLTGRSAGNMLSHTTAYLAIAFFLTSIGLTMLARWETRPSDIFDTLPGQTAPAGTQQPASPTPVAPPSSASDVLQQLGGPQAPPASGTPPANGGAQAPVSPPTPAPGAPAPSGGQ
jgi:preprotein translocase subunit SecG